MAGVRETLDEMDDDDRKRIKRIIIEFDDHDDDDDEDEDEDEGSDE